MNCKLFARIWTICLILFCSCNNRNECTPIKIHITEVWQNKDAFPTLIAIDNLLAAREEQLSKFDNTPPPKDDTSLSLFERMKRLKEEKKEENRSPSHPLFFLLHPNQISESSGNDNWIPEFLQYSIIGNGNTLYRQPVITLENSGFVGSSFTVDTEKVNNIFRDPEIKEKYLSNYSFYWGMNSNADYAFLYFTDKRHRTTDMDTSGISYITVRKEYESTSFFERSKYTMNVMLKNRFPFNTSDINKCHIVKITIGEKIYTRSIIGLSLKKEFSIADNISQADYELIKSCYGYILKKN